MEFIPKATDRTCAQEEVIENALSLDGKHILELGCGSASLTRSIASTGQDRTIIATEVDKIQHKKNLQIDDLENVSFIAAGGEDIPAEDGTFDIVFMFKSLHHVPMELMDQTLSEIHRVLKPGGLAYLSEPIFDGDFNELLCLFHDERIVLKAAFEAIEKAIADNRFSLMEEIVFYTPRHYADFATFEEQIINVTHNDLSLSDDLMATVKEQFSQYMTDRGAEFLSPIRVDLLCKA